MTDIDNFQDIIYGFAAYAQTIYTARSTGLYRSDDHGATWHDITGQISPDALTSVTCVVTSSDGRSIYAGVSGGILYSPDAGATWQGVVLPEPSPVISALAISPNFTEDDEILAGSMEDGVLRSSDGGRHWQTWNFGLLDLGIMCLAISPDYAHDETLFAGTESGVFCSTNGGRAWRELVLPCGYVPVLSMVISPLFSRDSTLYVGTEENGLFVSHDSGQSWQPTGAGVVESPVNSLLLDPQNPQWLLALGDGLCWLSRDAGTSWQAQWEDICAAQEVTSFLVTQGSGKRCSGLVGDGRR